MTMPPRHAVALALGLLLSAIAPVQAQAQTFTATLLNRPSGATSCFESLLEPELGDNGDVVATCSTPKVSLAGFFGAIIGGGSGIGETASKATVWRAGSAAPRTLTGTLSQTNTLTVGILSDGTVLGYAFNNSGQTLSAWKTTTRATYALPAGYSAWSLNQVSPGGKVILLRLKDQSSFGMGIATVTNGVAKKLPTPPSACGQVGSSFNSFGWRVNDLGHVVVLRNQHLYENYTSTQVGTVCLWNGSGWVVSDPTPNYQDPIRFDTQSYDLLLADFNNSDQVLLQQVTPFQWQAGTGYQQVDKAIVAYGAGTDVMGGDDSTAKLWRNGQLIDLQAASTGVPSGLRLSKAIGSNAKGQVLVLTQPTSATANNVPDTRLVLLTPR
jgi:hypothetical protein